MAYGALGTDTGGSCRIPAAMCGIVGFKPTAGRIPLAGAFPLSPSLDSVGPLARSVDCCATLDAVLSGEGFEPIPDLTASDLNLGVLNHYVTDGLEKTVADNYERALRALTKAGMKLTDIKLPELAELPDINRKGGISAAESYAVHRPRLANDAARYDPRVLVRIVRGREQDAADYIELLNIRANFIARIARRIRKFDAVLMPTIPIVAPVLSDLTSEDAYVKANGLALRNPSIVNFIDGCAITLPCHDPGTAPVGLSLFGLANTDADLLSVARVVEPIVAIDA
jgi:aspartyl-tRNA(Asn)/glutamyl-tRNA(Gln) amidotransferase subunit A